jgi:F-type H+-transporting ATPase subunit a
VSCLVNNFELLVSNFVPECPMVLVPFMVVIEMISYFVRPVALVLRIIVNLTCGHLLLVARGMIFNLIPLIAVAILETIVAVVQRFVMCMILTL